MQAELVKLMEEKWLLGDDATFNYAGGSSGDERGGRGSRGSRGSK